jgi:hypothetical protein
MAGSALLAAEPALHVEPVAGEGAARVAVARRAAGLGLCCRVLEPSSLLLDIDHGAAADAAGDRAARFSMSIESRPGPLNHPSRGMLLRMQLDAHTAVALRLCARGIGVFLAVRFSGGG